MIIFIKKIVHCILHLLAKFRISISFNFLDIFLKYQTFTRLDFCVTKIDLCSPEVNILGHRLLSVYKTDFYNKNRIFIISNFLNFDRKSMFEEVYSFYNKYILHCMNTTTCDPFQSFRKHFFIKTNLSRT